MDGTPFSRLDSKKRYLQIALNSTLDEAYKIIQQLPRSDRIILEAGTPLIKRYGSEGIRSIRLWYERHLMGLPLVATGQPRSGLSLLSLFSQLLKNSQAAPSTAPPPPNVSRQLFPYIVADLKMMDRGATEVELAALAGASAAVALGAAPVESLNAFIEDCARVGIDAMVDMMNVEYPLAVLRKLKKQPRVVILHRGVDEEQFNKEKMLPLYEIRRIKANYDLLISVAGGDTIKEVQSAIFNDADIVVVWKMFYQSTADTAELASQFLEQIK